MLIHSSLDLLRAAEKLIPALGLRPAKNGFVSTVATLFIHLGEEKDSVRSSSVSRPRTQRNVLARVRALTIQSGVQRTRH